jgi:F-type H+-transporting ATPase subunit gamma
LPSTREIRRRIRSVKNISQVTRAMQMVAASKMRRAQEQVLATRPYTEKAWQVLNNLAAQRGVDEEAHPLLQIREEIKTIGMVLITSDKGLCGSYNHNMIQQSARFIAELPYPVELITIGKRGRDAMWRMRQTIVSEFSDLPPQPRLLDITPIARTVMDGFVSGHFDVVYLAHTDFINTLTQRPAFWQLLPIRPLHLGVTPVSEYRGEERRWNTSTSRIRAPYWTPYCPGSPSCRSTRRSWRHWPASTAPEWWLCAMPPRTPTNWWTI